MAKEIEEGIEQLFDSQEGPLSDLMRQLQEGGLGIDTGMFPQQKETVQTEQILLNIKAILKAAGTDMSSIVKTTVYLTKPEDFAPMNKVYATYFTDDPPPRVTVFINSLPKGALVEIDAIARL